MTHTYKALSLNLIGEFTRFNHQSTLIHQMIRKNNIYQLIRFNVLVEISTLKRTPSWCIPIFKTLLYISHLSLQFIVSDIRVRLQLVFKFASLQSKWWLIYYIIDIHEGMHMVSSLLSTYILMISMDIYTSQYVYPVHAVQTKNIKEGNQYL